MPRRSSSRFASGLLSGSGVNNSGMRVKTSITLPEDLLAEIDRIDSNRSAVLERAMRLYLAQLAKAERTGRDAAILERKAVRLNREAADVLGYQRLPG
jgi:metal-responsive CopG/Arc/MetJ family transcriptional regulator